MNSGERDFYEQTKFLNAARRYGVAALLWTFGWGAGVLGAAVVLGLYDPSRV